MGFLKCTFEYVGLLKMRYGKEGVDSNLNTLTFVANEQCDE